MYLLKIIILYFIPLHGRSFCFKVGRILNDILQHYKYKCFLSLYIFSTFTTELLQLDIMLLTLISTKGDSSENSDWTRANASPSLSVSSQHMTAPLLPSNNTSFSTLAIMEMQSRYIQNASAYFLISMYSFTPISLWINNGDEFLSIMYRAWIFSLFRQFQVQQQWQKSVFHTLYVLRL